jgi:hypothetical protein
LFVEIDGLLGLPGRPKDTKMEGGDVDSQMKDRRTPAGSQLGKYTTSPNCPDMGKRRCKADVQVASLPVGSFFKHTTTRRSIVSVAWASPRALFINTIHLVLFGMKNRTFDPYLAAIDRILISLVGSQKLSRTTPGWLVPEGLNPRSRHAAPTLKRGVIVQHANSPRQTVRLCTGPA